MNFFILAYFNFLIIGRPDMVHNCTINNVSMSTLGIKCTEGFNGGLSQLFLLQLRDSHNQV